MITVLCANPALDVTYRVDRITPGSVHAVGTVWRRPGGKGGNVARVLRQLDAPVVLVAPLGGAGGAEYAAEIAGAGVELVAVPVAAPPRTSVCVLDEDATVFNEPGPELTDAEWDQVHAAVLRTDPQVLVLAGSLPPGAPIDAYARLVAAAGEAVTIVDTRGPAFAASLSARPDVVTPNRAEAREILGGDGAGAPMSAMWCAAELRHRGAAAAVVSDGPDGLAAATADGNWRARPPRALSGNPTGAGDALTAALALGLSQHRPWPAVLRDAVATSAAALGCDTAGEIDPAFRAGLADRIVLEEVHDAARQHR